MFTTLGLVLGGIGLFLLGMQLLTDGLKTAAGEALRRVLARFTGGRAAAVLSGAGVTALVQSSSATTLATIGFVSAGLLTFQQAVGVIIGANVGTTSTGWLVSMLGLKFSVSVVAMPLVGLGALLRLFTRGRPAALALAAAGFGLIFVGIDTLQAGMKDLRGVLDLEALPAAGLSGQALLVLVGIVMTVILQSSSAAVAMTLAALDGGALTLHQASALVIGQNVGTTVTAGLACIGGSTGARRTAVAHVLFNVLTGVVAFAALNPFVRGAQWVGEALEGPSHFAVMLAAFHTAFNLLGMLLVLPWLGTFARLVERLVPERGPVLGRHLDASVADIPALAIDAARRTLREIALLQATQVRALFSESAAPPASSADPRPTALALASTRDFLARIPAAASGTTEHARYLSVLHALDHGERLEEGLREALPGQRTLRAPELLATIAVATQGLDQVLAWLRGDAVAEPAPESARQMSETVARLRKSQRPELLERAARGEAAPETTLRQLDTIRWIDRVIYHVWRLVHHLAEGEDSTGPQPQADAPLSPSTAAAEGPVPGADGSPDQGSARESGGG